MSIRFALHFEEIACACGRGDYTTAGLGARERGFEVQHVLETRGVREDFAHRR
jgi:hypothetical protein